MSDFEKLINASDLIEWIIETNPDWCVGSVRSIIDHIDKMPSKQPVLCKDCKHYIPHDKRCGRWNHGVKTYDWCSRAEGGEDESD